jgi:hypothetical protein
MNGLVGKVLGMFKVPEQINPGDYTKDFEKLNDSNSETKKSDIKFGECIIPKVINPEGLYVVKIMQAELFNPTNEYITRLIIYDRKEKIAIDVTSDTRPSNTVSDVPNIQFLSSQGITSIDNYLTGVEKPMFGGGIFRGVSSFIARELADVCYNSLRLKLFELKNARLLFDTATNAFLENSASLRNNYSISESKPLE